jgi:aconitate hydratase
LPLQFSPGESAQSLGLTGEERYTIRGLGGEMRPGQVLEVEAEAEDGGRKTFRVGARLDNQTDVEYLRHGGILPMVLRQKMAG